MYQYRKNCALWQAALLVVLCMLMTGCFGDPQVNETKPTGPQQTTAPTASTAPAETTPTSPLSAEFYDLVDQLTLKELREIQAIMEEKIRNRK